MKYDEFISHFQSRTGKTAKKTGSGHTACCPAHEDENPSLSMSEGTDGRILLKCFAGCPIETICSSLDLTVSDLFDQNLSNQQQPKKFTYSYKDETGREVYRKIRMEPGLAGKDKSFYAERTGDNGETIYNISGCRRVLYHLPEVMKAISDGIQVFLVEGEKDADKLMNHGLIATTAPESLKWSDEFNEMLKGADIVLLYDMDETGFKRKDLLCENLHNRVKRLRVVDLPGLEYCASHGSDVSDWLAKGNTTTQLLEIVAKTPDYAPAQPKEKIRVVSMDEFLNMQLPKRELILTPFLPTQGLCLLYAKRGVGKTHVALGIGYAVATGGTFLKWHAPKPRKVLYIDGEMPAIAMQERLRRASVAEDLKLPGPDFLRLITPDLQEGPMPDLSAKEGRDSIEKFIESSDLIIFDNISTLFRSGIENEAESWQPVQDWALELRRRGKSVLFIHHAAKGGQQRGTSKKEDILDTVILLKQPQGYRADEGACFEVIFEKTRHFAGEDAAGFQVQLHEQNDGLWKWEISETEADVEVSEVAEAVKEGLKIKEIIQKTGLTKSQVETRIKKAKNQGLI
jgi:hypothetical protein